MKELTFSNLEHLLSSLIDGSALDENNIIKLDKSLNVLIKVNGETWDGEIDYRVSKFVTELQRHVINIYNDFYNTNFTLRSLPANQELIVTVKIEKGCSLFTLDLDKFFEHIGKGFNDMESRHKLIAIVASLLIGFGGYFAKETYNTYMEMLNKQNEAQREMHLYDTFEKINRNSLAPHMYSLARSVPNNDTITVNGKEYTPKEALSEFRYEEEKEESVEKTFYVFDNFVVSAAYFKKNEVHLEIGSKDFIASIQTLSETDKKLLYDGYYAADKQGNTPSLDLLLSITLVNGKISPAFVTGVATGRDDAIKFVDMFTTNQ